MNHDTDRGARELPVLSPGEYVWVTDQEESGEVVEETAMRSYTVQTPGGEFRKNRRHLNRSSSSSETNTESDVTPRKSENLPAQVPPTKVQLVARPDRETIALESHQNGSTIVGLELKKRRMCC